MEKNNLTNIQLGAPSTIVGGASPNAELSVQFMGLCEELTLKEGVSRCTKDGALKTAAKLLSKWVSIDDKSAVANFMELSSDNFNLIVENNILSQLISKNPSIIQTILDNPSIIPTICNYPNLVSRALRQNEYIQDGLVLMLNPLTIAEYKWINYVDNTFEFMNQNAVIDNNGISSGIWLSEKLITNNPIESTIEVVFKSNTTTGVLFAGGVQNGICAAMYSGRYLFNETGYCPFKNFATGKLMTVCNNGMQYFENCEFIGNNGSKDNWTSVAKSSVGCAANQSGAYAHNFDGKIYEIRIYNRQLTEEEILHNQAIDLEVYAGL